MSHKRDRIDGTSKVDMEDLRAKDQTIRALRLGVILMVLIRENKRVHAILHFRGIFLLVLDMEDYIGVNVTRILVLALIVGKLATWLEIVLRGVRTLLVPKLRRVQG